MARPDELVLWSRYGFYYDPDIPAIVPDGFLSLGVERIVNEDLRLSYVLWEEENIVPIFVLEVVSTKYRGEYSSKKALYADMGVLYYAVYSSRCRRKPPLELYRLVDGKYEQLSGNPIWLPEIGLGLGRDRGSYLREELLNRLRDRGISIDDL